VETDGLSRRDPFGRTTRTSKFDLIINYT